MEKYIICEIKEVARNKYVFWNGLDEDGNRYYNRERFLVYYEAGLPEKIPLPDNVYHAIAYLDTDESFFIGEDDENILNHLDPIGADYICYESGPNNMSSTQEDRLYFVYFFYDYDDLQYAITHLEEFFKKKNGSKEQK